MGDLSLIVLTTNSKEGRDKLSMWRKNLIAMVGLS